MLIVLASLGLIRHHLPLDVATSTNHRVRTVHRTAFFCRRPAMPLPSSNAEGAPPFQCFLLLFVGADVDRPRLAEVDPAPLSHLHGKQRQYQ